MSYQKAKEIGNHNDFKIYHSEYIDFLIRKQARAKKYEVIPCTERKSYSENDTWVDSFLFTIKCNNDNWFKVRKDNALN